MSPVSQTLGLHGGDIIWLVLVCFVSSVTNLKAGTFANVPFKLRDPEPLTRNSNIWLYVSNIVLLLNEGYILCMTKDTALSFHFKKRFSF